MTLGRRALLNVLQRTVGVEVAARCRVSPSCVSEWASGQARPSKRAQRALERIYGIAESAWSTVV
jgi:ribosome-binding protein aMBF1 (putative translation factor)